MPSVTITRSWPDNDLLQVSVAVDHGYPDELAEALRLALDGYREALGLTLADGE